MQDSILIGWADGPQILRLDRANRHGLVAGATGTGKTVTLQILAQGFSDNGVPVFAADVKGDLSGVAMPGAPNEKFLAHARTMHLDLTPAAPPTIFWDVYGVGGHPIRTTISDMGPLLLARILGLNEVQQGVLTIAFHVADKDGLLLLDLKDLQAVLRYVGENARAIGAEYGNVAPATIGAIQRALLGLERQGADQFFGEPALRLADLMRCDAAGRGVCQRAGGRPPGAESRALRHLPAVAALRPVRAASRGRRPRSARSSCSSSTRRTCCSATPRGRCWRRSSRWFG